MTSFVQIKTIHPFPGVGLDYPRPEDTPGVFIEHFDFSPPYGEGRNGIIYGPLHEAAKEASALVDWVFRSYSVVESPGTDADWSARQIRQFPTLILFRDGVELGRHFFVFNTVPGILFWANHLLGIECEAPGPVPIPAFLRDRCHITPSGMVLRKEESTIQFPPKASHT